MIFVTLITLSIILFLGAQWIDAKTQYKQPVWFIYALPLTVYILTYGMRDGWFIDYAVYENIYVNPFMDDDYEPFFVIVNKIMRLLGFPLFMAMTVYVAFFVVGYFWFASEKRKYLGITMAVIVLLNVSNLGMLIRWLMGCGLLYAGMRCFLDKQWIKSAVFVILASCVHLPLIIVAFIAFLIYYGRPFRNIYVNFALLVFGLLLTPEIMATAALRILEPLNIFPDSLRVANYVTDPRVMDKYFSGDNLGITENATFLHSLRLLFYYGWFLFWGYWVIRQNKSDYWMFLYNLFAIGALIYIPTEGFELVMRFGTAFMLPGAVLIARVIFDQWKEGKYVCSLISSLLLIMQFIMILIPTMQEYDLKYISL